jgi:hypothetical protein
MTYTWDWYCHLVGDRASLKWKEVQALLLRESREVDNEANIDNQS